MFSQSLDTNAEVLPIIQQAHALTSWRQSGFSFPASVGELVDNSIEAGASKIACYFYKGSDGLIEEIATSDNGSGMSESVLHGYPVIGRSTRYGSVSGIGKFGMGAKLGALTYCKKFVVYSREKGEDSFRKVEFDLELAMELEQDGRSGEIGVHRPVVVETLPEKYNNIVNEDTRTLVVWCKVDKLQAGKRPDSDIQISENLISEVGRIFRYFIYNGVEIEVNGNKVEFFDPIMQLQGSQQDRILTTYYNPESKFLNHYPATSYLKDIEICRLGDEVATLSVVLYPKEVLRKAGMGGDRLAKALRVPDNKGRISFVRNGREISYTHVPKIFGRAVLPADRFIGVEVKFTPVFDEFFGVRHVKRGVEPFDIVRKEIREHMQNILPVLASAIQTQWHGGESIDFDEVEKIVQKANSIMLHAEHENGVLTEQERATQRDALMELAKEIGVDDLEGFAEKKLGKPYVIEVIDSIHNDFLDFRFMDNQVHIGVNRNHLMYKEVWEPLYTISKQNANSVALLNPVETANIALNALNIMLVCMAKTKSLEGISEFDKFVKGWGLNMDRFLRQVK
ncbi:ATP-binding protein [Vibrio sp. D431a]|uniref:ATP-binding protein n=1 Tax=Vibrio sp. D431a TaxID=2837388 RepID=UPI0025526FF7|nr:ATP-binding protein [Vibrio sp. D431a]MDK9790053.1 ATP-binding protein [Vibrio sp. D431a]